MRQDALIATPRGALGTHSMPRGFLRIEKTQVRIIILAECFEKGAWRYWEHQCDWDEIPAFEDSAFANARNRGSFAAPTSVDYLRGAEYLFNTLSDPREPRSTETFEFSVSR